jgi:signal transduction histidine kinase
MSKRFFYLVTLAIFCSIIVIAQKKIEPAVADSVALQANLETAQTLFFRNPDSSLFFALEAVRLARQQNNYKALTGALNAAGEQYRFLGEFPKSFELQFEALKENRLHKDRWGEATTMGFIGFSYLEMGDERQALNYLLPAKPVLDSSGDTILTCFVTSHIGSCYTNLGKMDSAFYFNKEAYRLFPKDYYGALRTLVSDRLGEVYEKNGQWPEAVGWYHYSLYYARQTSILVNISRAEKRLASLYAARNQIDSALYYGRLAYQNSGNSRQKLHNLNAALILADLFKSTGLLDSALYYQSAAIKLKDSIYGQDQYNRLQRVLLEEQRLHQERQEQELARQNRLKFSLLGVVIVSLMVVTLILRRNNRQRLSANLELGRQKKALEKTLHELKATQSQLIQAEKMASLGELTAGIAHEIQNPLNFVNNFSDLNSDLIEDIKEVVEKNDNRQLDRLLDQLKENEDKIKLHGKRAEGIVRSMLQHSKSGSAQKERTDINKLVDEYVRLAYHGMRAKDKTFNVTLETDFDPQAGSVDIIPQDIGRVLLNLLNNAFYAVQERSKSGEAGYIPTVRVRTFVTEETTNTQMHKYLNIAIRDNGPGIPEKIRSKIFQPFFTTKPTGQGTGLGLSLSYDIITRGHGGELTVDTKDGELTEFIIKLP